jgi:putative thiamine transport system ATP-binding protein
MRTLLAEPRALLLDEPFSRLHASLRAITGRVASASVVVRTVPRLVIAEDACRTSVNFARLKNRRK